MKKICINTALVLISFYANSQQNQNTSLLRLRLPLGTTELAPQKFKDLSEENFKEKVVFGTIDKKLFKKGDILFSYWNLTDNPRFKQSLEQKEKWMSSMYKKKGELYNAYEFRNSKIVTVNNVRCMIINYKKQDNYFTSFYTDYNKNNEYLAGNLEYKSIEETNAIKLLQELLENITIN